MYGILGIGAVAAFFGVMWQLEVADHKVTQASYEIVQRNEDKLEAQVEGLNTTILTQNDSFKAILQTNNFLRDQRAADRKMFDTEIDALNAWRRTIKDAVVRAPGQVAGDAGVRVVERMRDIWSITQRAGSGNSRENNQGGDLPSGETPGDTTSANN